MMILSEIMISLNACNWRLLHYLQMLTKDDDLIRDHDLNTCNWRLLHYLQMLTKDDLIRDHDISEHMQLALYSYSDYSDFTRTLLGPIENWDL